MNIKGILAARGVHFLVTRYGPDWLRKIAFDEKYRSGKWRFADRDGSGELSEIIRSYLQKGNLLILGCGGCSILEGMDTDMTSAVGVDLSAEAIALASRYASKNVTFWQGNMLDFECDRSFNVILFSESIYYVPTALQTGFLKRLAQSLSTGGVFVVTLAQPSRYGRTLEMIRENFHVREDRFFKGSSRHVMVFSTAPGR